MTDIDDHESKAYNRYERFIDWRIDNDLSGIEWRLANLSKPDWYDEFLKLDCTDAEFEQALTAAAARFSDPVWRKRLGGPWGHQVICHEVQKIVAKRRSSHGESAYFRFTDPASWPDTPDTVGRGASDPKPTPEPTQAEILMAEGFTPIEAERKLRGESDLDIFEHFFPDVSDRLRAAVESRTNQLINTTNGRTVDGSTT